MHAPERIAAEARELRARAESWPLAAPFRISRGTKIAADVVVAELRAGDRVGRGEAVPYARYGESRDSVLAQLEAIAPAVAAGADRRDLARLLPPGAARNAVDCALWDLAAQLTGRSVAEQLGLPEPAPLTTAVTVALDSPDRMRAAAERLAGARVVKVKVDATDPEAQLRAVHAGAPAAVLVVDANESWTANLLRRMQPVLAATNVVLLEQPLPAGADDALVGLAPACRICADESCHTAADLPGLAGKYQAVNVKLDKTGGLTGALELVHAAHAAGFVVMVGCMVATSLSIAPASLVAQSAQFVDLDGPWWLKIDRFGGARFVDGGMAPCHAALWGWPRPA